MGLSESEKRFRGARPVQFGSVAERSAWLRDVMSLHVGTIPQPVVHAVFDLLSELELCEGLPVVSAAAAIPARKRQIRNDLIDSGVK